MAVAADGDVGVGTVCIPRLRLSNSLVTRAELGQMRDWMTWLKEQFDRAETEGREHLQRELARIAPDRSERGDDKWQIAICLYSPAQSIRNSAIKLWNERPTWIKLSAVHNDKQAVEVEFTLGDIVHMQQVGIAGYRAARLFVAAMNIGSTGFWWWTAPTKRESSTGVSPILRRPLA
jgi:hypothetical protein